MDSFTSNMVTLLRTEDFRGPNARLLKLLKDILVSAGGLRYPSLKNQTLNFLANSLAAANFLGEAYRAASLLPEGHFKDTAGLMPMIDSKGPKPRSLEVGLEIVSYCNLKCPLCTNAKESGKDYYQHGKIMPFQTFKKIWDDIRPYVSLLILVGQGETFLHPDIYKMLDYVKPTPVHIDTNGNAKINPALIIDSSVTSLLFSIDGVDQRTYGKYRAGGDFEKAVGSLSAVAAAKRAARKGPRLTWKYVVFKHNEAYTDQLQPLAQRAGADSVQFVACQVTPMNTKDLIREFMPLGLSEQAALIRYVDFQNNALGLYEANDSPYCSAPLVNPHIRINGDIEVCCSAYSPVGNVLEDGLSKVWNSEEYSSLRKRILSDRLSFHQCRACSRQQLNLGRVFDGTELEYKRPPEPVSSDILRMKDLTVDQDYLKLLHENGLKKDLEYYRARKLITEEQASGLNIPLPPPSPEALGMGAPA
ncbi:MAG: radical SAM protein [Deltaproteobacteria bacterium]|jgi:MoaA/NifB/PqqE/SkfB family radical SAM enzyme|nr:radical SAM protein [Deltaproteobacteria bacterium]